MILKKILNTIRNRCKQPCISCSKFKWSYINRDFDYWCSLDSQVSCDTTQGKVYWSTGTRELLEERNKNCDCPHYSRVNIIKSIFR